jgi:hypothetical protein
MASTKKRAPPTPPRRSGDAGDIVAIGHWLDDFYNFTVRETGLLDPSFQAAAGTFDPAALPDPAATSIARAQLVANEAYQRGRLAPFLVTEFSLDGTNNEITFPFETPPADADYRVIVQARDFTGAPSASAFVVTRIVRTKEQFVVTLAAAPGAGNSVSFDCILFPAN